MRPPPNKTVPDEFVDDHCLAARWRARAITRLYEAKLRPHGLRATQFSVLAALARMGATPRKHLADTLGLERTTLTRIGAVLKRNGWVSTVQSNKARERRFRLTGAGRRKLEAAFAAWKEAQGLVERRLVGLVGRGGDPMSRWTEDTDAVDRSPGPPCVN